MTAIATIFALLPMALGLSKAGVFIAGPLAIVVIGGLTSSTILTLLLVPTLYVIVEDIKGRFWQKASYTVYTYHTTLRWGWPRSNWYW